MALRDQPYFPLYVQDIMTDEALNECSAATHGIYIKGLLCLMHKSKTYGKILLKQKPKQNESKSLLFGYQLAKHTPYTPEEIKNAIDELISEGVCHFEGEYLCQKRMIKDNEISLARSKAGKKGGESTQKNKFAKAKTKANNKAKLQSKVEANSEYEYENENEDEIEIENKIYSSSIILNKEKLIEKISVNDEWIFAKCREHNLTKVEFHQLLGLWASSNNLVPFKEERHIYNSLNLYVLKNKKEKPDDQQSRKISKHRPGGPKDE